MSRDPFLVDVERQFVGLRALADRALAQLADADLRREICPNDNSIAVIMKHVAGNMRSRWTDFLTTDGEKPTRDRDTEFVLTDQDTMVAVEQSWDDGWEILLATIRSLSAADLGATVLIRAEPHSVIQATLRQLSHYSYHVGQIVFLARSLVGDDWRSLSIAKTESEAFNAAPQSYLRGSDGR